MSLDDQISQILMHQLGKVINLHMLNELLVDAARIPGITAITASAPSADTGEVRLSVTVNGERLVATLFGTIAEVVHG